MLTFRMALFRHSTKASCIIYVGVIVYNNVQREHQDNCEYILLFFFFALSNCEKSYINDVPSACIVQRSINMQLINDV